MKNESFILYKKLCQSMGEEEVHKILSQEQCDIEPNFLGFVNVYKHLSYIIPKHFTIVDLGCAYAAQGFYFRNHKTYLGIDSEPKQAGDQ